MPAAHRRSAGRAFLKSSLFKRVWRHGVFAWRYEGVRDAGRSRGFMCLCEWRRRHPAHGDLPGSLAGPVSKPAGTVRSSFLPVFPADGLAGACRGQPGRRGQALYSLHPRITGPGLEWCEDGGIMRPVRGGGDKFSRLLARPALSQTGERDKREFLPAEWPVKTGRRAGTDRSSYQAISLPSVPDSAAALPGKTGEGERTISTALPSA